MFLENRAGNGFFTDPQIFLEITQEVFWKYFLELINPFLADVVIYFNAFP